MKTIDLFSQFLKVAYRKSGDSETFLNIAKELDLSGEVAVDFFNRLLTLFEEIPMVVFSDDLSRFKIISDLRDFIHDFTLETELELNVVDENQEAKAQAQDEAIDTLFDMFDL